MKCSVLTMSRCLGKPSPRPLMHSSYNNDFPAHLLSNTSVSDTNVHSWLYQYHCSANLRKQSMHGRMQMARSHGCVRLQVGAKGAAGRKRSSATPKRSSAPGRATTFNRSRTLMRAEHTGGNGNAQIGRGQSVRGKAAGGPARTNSRLRPVRTATARKSSGRKKTSAGEGGVSGDLDGTESESDSASDDADLDAELEGDIESPEEDDEDLLNSPSLLGSESGDSGEDSMEDEDAFDRLLEELDNQYVDIEDDDDEPEASSEDIDEGDVEAVAQLEERRAVRMERRLARKELKKQQWREAKMREHAEQVLAKCGLQTPLPF
jgi:hypothetical protein